MMDPPWRGIISQCSLKIGKSVADNCLKPLQVSSSKAECGSKCQAKSIHASQDSFCVVIHRPCWPLTLGRPGIMFSCSAFFSPCTREYDSIGHKLITFTKMRIPHRKPLSSHLSHAATPTARPREVRWAEFTWRCWRKTADDLQLESCETQLLARGAQMIRMLSVPFGFWVSVKHFSSRGCFFKRSLPHFPADFTHPIKS